MPSSAFPVFAVLHIADFALHAVLRTEPDPSQPESGRTTRRPAALFAGTGKKSLVLAANPEARAAGIETGMTAPQAVARCPELIIRAPHSAAESEARAALLAVGFTLSPTVEDTAPGICTCDLKGGSSRPEPLAAAAVAHLAQLGLPATAGIARTPLLALYAARHTATTHHAPIGDLWEQAHPAHHLAEAAASYLSSPRPVLTVTAEEEFLSPLPLVVADPPPELALVFEQWGLRTLGDLIALPRDEIVRRFGAAGLALWNRAAGGAPRPLHPVSLARDFHAALAFEEAVESLEPLLFLLRRFLERLTLELRATQHVAAEVELTLRLEDDTRHTRQFRLPEPTANPETLLRALHTHLESLRTAAAVSALEIRLTPTRPLVRQQGLFDTGLRDPHGFAETLARVAALVGSDRVGTPQPADTHRPDTVTLTPPLAVVPPPATPPVHPPYGLPLRRFRPPLPATLEFAPPERRPTYLFTSQFQGDIAEIRGPWRSSGDWWQSDRAWERLEWDIALIGGGLYRLLQVGGAYFVEGEYD